MPPKAPTKDELARQAAEQAALEILGDDDRAAEQAEAIVQVRQKSVVILRCHPTTLGLRPDPLPPPPYLDSIAGHLFASLRMLVPGLASFGCPRVGHSLRAECAAGRPRPPGALPRT